MSIPDIETLIHELIPSWSEKRNVSDIRCRMEIATLIEDYFGKEDARLVLAIALYFKFPSKYYWLCPLLKERLQLEEQEHG